MSFNKTTSFLIVISNSLFLLLYFSLGYHNRLAIDDFHFLANVKEFGILNGTIEEYNSWSSRWVSVLLNHFVLFMNEKWKWTLFTFSLLNLTFFVITIQFLTKKILNCFFFGRKLNIGLANKNTWIRFNISLFLVSLLFITTFSIAETWFWLCSTTTYLWSNIMFFLGLACLLGQKKQIKSSVIGGISFIYVGGSSGPLALISIFILFSFLIISTLDKLPNNISKKSFNLKTTLYLCCCLFSFLILYFSKGNTIRLHSFEEISIFYSIILNFKMVGIILLKQLPFTILLSSYLCLPIGALLKVDSDKIKINLKRDLLLTTLTYVIILFLYQLSITYKTSDIGANRALFFVSLLSTFFILIVYFLLLNTVKITYKRLKFITILPLLSSILIFGILFFKQQPLLSNYSHSYDQRIHFLNNVENRNKTLELSPLSPSGLLFSAEISTDTSHFSNQHMKKGLGLNFTIALEKN